MDIKPIEFSGTTKFLDKVRVALESSYKAHTKIAKRKEKNLSKKKAKLEVDLRNLSSNHAALEAEINQIPPIIINGATPAIIKDPVLFEQLYKEKILKGQQNNADIAKMNQYRQVLLSKENVEKALSEVRNAIVSVKAKIAEKQTKSEAAKKDFSDKYTKIIIAGLCGKGKNLKQNIKVSFAGKHIVLKGDSLEELSRSASGLRLINKVAHLIEVKTAQEELKNSKDASKNQKVAELSKLEEELTKEIEAAKSSSYKERLNGLTQDVKNAKMAMANVRAFKALAKRRGLSSENQIFVAVLKEETEQNENCKLAMDAIDELKQQIANSSKSEAEKKEAIKQIKAEVVKLQKEVNAIDASVTALEQTLSSKVANLVDDEEDDVKALASNPAAVIEKLTEKTAFGLSYKKPTNK